MVAASFNTLGLLLIPLVLLLQCSAERPHVCKMEFEASDAEIKLGDIVRDIAGRGQAVPSERYRVVGQVALPAAPPGVPPALAATAAAAAAAAAFAAPATAPSAASGRQVEVEQVAWLGGEWELVRSANGRPLPRLHKEMGKLRPVFDYESKGEYPCHKPRAPAGEDHDSPGRPYLCADRYVLGATTYQMEKLQGLLIGKEGKSGPLADRPNDGWFDILVIDEASQMPLAQLLPPLALLRHNPAVGQEAPSTGRLVVVGDPRQMGTILKNDYPAEAEVHRLDCHGMSTRTEADLPPHTCTLLRLSSLTCTSPAASATSSSHPPTGVS